MILKGKMKLTDADKATLTKALKDTGNLPPTQGSVTLNISPEGKVSTVEFNFVKK